MTLYFFLYILSIYSGYFYIKNNYLIFPLILISIFPLIKKRFLFFLSLFIIFVSGYILSLKSEPVLTEGNYEFDLSVKRSLKNDYIVSKDNLNFLLKTDLDFLEGDRIYGIFKVEKLDFENDYEKYLENYDVFYRLKILKVDSVRSLKTVNRFRAILVNRVKEKYDDQKISGFINSILLGYRKDLDTSLKKDFINSGVIHLIAISGQHVLIIYSFLFLVFYFIPIKKRAKVLVSIMILFFYSFLTYNNPPVVRSVIFITIFLIGEFTGRRVDRESLIFLTFLFMLIFNKSNFKDNGFILSFLAVYGIYISTQNFQIKSGFLKLFLTSITVLIITIPYMMFQFKYISVGSPFFTFILYLPFSILIPMSILSIIPFFGFFTYPVNYIFKFIENVVGFSERLYLMYNFQIDLILFVFLETIVILIFYKKFKFSFVFSTIIFFYVIYSINRFC